VFVEQNKREGVVVVAREVRCGRENKSEKVAGLNNVGNCCRSRLDDTTS
jgi:hypothetical protein